mgnify:CR=1 FL=1
MSMATSTSEPQPEMVLQVVDITALTQANQERAAMARAGIVGLWEWNLDNDTLTWDGAMHHLHGSSAPDPDQPISAEAWLSNMKSEDQAFAQAEAHHCLLEHQPYRLRYGYRWPDGSPHQLQSIGAPPEQAWPAGWRHLRHHRPGGAND